MELFLTLLDRIQLGIDPDQFVVSERWYDNEPTVLKWWSDSFSYISWSLGDQATTSLESDQHQFSLNKINTSSRE